VDVNTIIGQTIRVNGDTDVIPVSKVSFGLGSAGSDFPSSKDPKELFGGGVGCGVTITPVAFLVVKPNGVQLLQVADPNRTGERLLNLLPGLMDKLSELLPKKEEKKETFVTEDGE
jgi:sporulation protein YtfJ